MRNDANEWIEVVKIFRARMNIYTFQKDIALVKLTSSSQQVIQRAIAMPKPSSDVECLIYGYGQYRTNKTLSNVVRYGRINIISYRECENILGRVTAPIYGSSQFCALGINGADACLGRFHVLIYTARPNHKFYHVR